MIKIKITVNGRRFNDINKNFNALEENVSQKKQEIIQREYKTHEAW